MGVSVVMNILLNILLIKDYGIEGVAIATAVSMAAWNLIMLYYLRKKTGINPLPVASKSGRIIFSPNNDLPVC